jgi:hypothetical protein
MLVPALIARQGLRASPFLQITQGLWQSGSVPMQSTGRKAQTALVANTHNRDELLAEIKSQRHALLVHQDDETAVTALLALWPLIYGDDHGTA